MRWDNKEKTWQDMIEWRREKIEKLMEEIEEIEKKIENDRT